jgi:protein required for attachment to host cells
MNSLIIVADASRARLFRIAKASGSEDSNELIELDSVRDTGAIAGQTAAPRFAERIARQAARFALHHVCNPVVVAAPPGTSRPLLDALERQLPETYIRSIVRDMTALEPPELLHDLQQSLARPEPGTAPVA